MSSRFGNRPGSKKLIVHKVFCIVSSCIYVIVSDEFELPFEGILDYHKYFHLYSLGLENGMLLSLLTQLDPTFQLAVAKWAHWVLGRARHKSINSLAVAEDGGATRAFGGHPVLFRFLVGFRSTVVTTSAPNVFANAVPNRARYGSRERMLTQMSTGEKGVASSSHRERVVKETSSGSGSRSSSQEIHQSLYLEGAVARTVHKQGCTLKVSGRLYELKTTIDARILHRGNLLETIGKQYEHCSDLFLKLQSSFAFRRIKVFIMNHYAGLGQIASLILMLIAPTNMAKYMGQMAAAMVMQFRQILILEKANALRISSRLVSLSRFKDLVARRWTNGKQRSFTSQSRLNIEAYPHNHCKASIFTTVLTMNTLLGTWENITRRYKLSIIISYLLEDEDGDDEGHNDLEEDEDYHLPHPDIDQDDHEIDDEFDDYMIKEEDENEEGDDGGVNPFSRMPQLNIKHNIKRRHGLHTFSPYEDTTGAHPGDDKIHETCFWVSFKIAFALVKYARKLESVSLSCCSKLTDEASGFIIDNSSSSKLLKIHGCTKFNHSKLPTMSRLNTSNTKSTKSPDLSKDSLAACDVAVFVYDSSDESSLKRASELLMDVAREVEESGYCVPCLLISTKSDSQSYLKEIKETNMVRNKKHYQKLVHHSLIVASVGTAVAIALTAYRTYAIKRINHNLNQPIYCLLQIAVGTAVAIALTAYRTYAIKRKTLSTFTIPKVLLFSVSCTQHSWLFSFHKHIHLIMKHTMCAKKELKVKEL
ncbi:mitochondrial Rho GTPase 1 [Artemisia annua]|uniref:Mitochondrial Rho GTPase 1 n=1 Tax=Artemisia annua TaxID=35608 RepID=A0A2U1MPZ7_ARTAN|nr:mitochondrial Rho GTPase 1 [Artemisia annua]